MNKIRLVIKNRYAAMWRENVHLRVNFSLYKSLIWNSIYAVFLFWLGFRHHTFWYYSMSGYYISLAAMRFFLVRHTRKHRPGEEMRKELVRYLFCGIMFLIMNLALSLMIFFMVYWNRTFYHHEITAIAMATYTFTSFTMAIINTVRYRKYKSPVYSASKIISLASACVSMLTLESTMFTAFGKESTELFTRRIFLAVSGGAVSVFIIVMAIYMIVVSIRMLGKIKNSRSKSNNVG